MNWGLYPGFTGNIPKFPQLDRRYVDTTTYTLSDADIDWVLVFRAATAVTVTLPPTINGRVTSAIHLFQEGAGKVSVVAGSGVVIKSPGGLLGTRLQNSVISLMRSDAANWYLFGDLA